MRLYRNAAILIVILGLMVGAYFYLNTKKDKNPADSDGDSQIIKVWELDKDKLDRLTIEGEADRIIIDNKDKKLSLTEPANLKYTESKLQDIVSNAVAVSADKVIEENASDIAQYGLDKPVEFSVKLQDGTVKNGQIGDATPSNSGFYFKEKENNKVYVISTYTGENIKVTRNDLKDKKMYTAKPEEVSGVSLERSGKTVFSAKQEGESSWSLVAPFEGNADASNLLTMIGSVLEAQVTEFVEENPADLDKYGLKNPAYAVELDTKLGKKKLLFGDEKEKGVSFYAKFADSSEVFTTGASSFNFLDKPLKEIVDVFVYITNIDDVSKIEIDMNGTKAVADVSTDKDDKANDKFSINGKDVMNVKVGEKTGDGLFRVLYQSLIGITLEDIDLDAKPSGKPYLTIIYTLKKAPGTMKVEYIPKDDKTYYAIKNGKYTNILAKKSEVEHVFEKYKNLIDAVESAK